jgi:uncharacterized protein
MSQKDFASSKIYYDTKHYPRGFHRSGIYSRREAELLERHGYAMKELASGARQPATPAEQQFVQVCKGEMESQTELEKAWLKYYRAVTTRRVIYTAGATSMDSEGGESADFDMD